MIVTRGHVVAAELARAVQALVKRIATETGMTTIEVVERLRASLAADPPPPATPVALPRAWVVSS